MSDFGECIYADDPSHHLDAGHAVTAALQQTAYFQSIDRMQMDLEDGCIANTTKDDFDQQLQRSVEKLSRHQPLQVHVEGSRSAGAKEDALQRQLRASMQKIETKGVASETVVMEAAFSLIQDGILNTPDIGIVNVKQARALLWNAAWLQEHINAIWRDAGVLPKRAQQSKNTFLDDCSLAIMGPGGTGKTAVFKTIHALIEFFA